MKKSIEQFFMSFALGIVVIGVMILNACSNIAREAKAPRH